MNYKLLGDLFVNAAITEVPLWVPSLKAVGKKMTPCWIVHSNETDKS